MPRFVSLEGPTECIEIYYTHGRDLLQRKTQTEVSQGKQYIEQSLRKYPIQSFHCTLSIIRTLTLSILMCNNNHRLLPIREAHQSLSIQSFY